MKPFLTEIILIQPGQQKNVGNRQASGNATDLPDLAAGQFVENI